LDGNFINSVPENLLGDFWKKPIVLLIELLINYQGQTIKTSFLIINSIEMLKTFNRRNKKIIIFIWILHLCSYIPFSLSGEFELCNFGGSDWRTLWHPNALTRTYMGYSGRTKSTISLAGVFYYPYIILDRMLWHKTKFPSA
jgi:hypothetical protein